MRKTKLLGILLTPIVTILIFIILMIKLGVLIIERSIDVTNLSVTAGVPYQLYCDETDIHWQSSNPNVTVNEGGQVLAVEDKYFPDGNAQITAISKKNNAVSCSYNVTIVPWTTNGSKISDVDATPMFEIFGLKIHYPDTRLSTQFILPSMVVHASIEGVVYFSKNKNLYKTSDNFKSQTLVARLPFRPGKQRMLVTPLGYFLRGEKCVYYSSDMEIWECSLTTNHPAWLLDNMDFWHDRQENKVYVYTSEYSVIPGATHLLYRGTVDPTKKPTWETVFTLKPETDLQNDSGNLLRAARHFHLVKVDPYTGDVWFGTGDMDNQAIIKRSTDNGNTFNLVGTGSQEYRTLGFWFTKNYIYWNMDKTYPDQMIFRIKRSDLNENKSITPILNAGVTKIGVDYLVYSENLNDYFPVPRGEKYTETKERELSDHNQVIAVTDPYYNRKEMIANLTNGSHWSVFDVKTSNGETVTLLSSTSEGFRRYKTRDNLGRVFGIHEDAEGIVTVAELLSIPAYDGKNEKARLEAIVQAEDGTIYFQSFHSIYGGSIIRGRLDWQMPIEIDELELNLEIN
ncbi:MAG: hypothetical protein JJU34_20815 [Lunatimonas sp.]|uniref:hypothetical protein n=1 Tax=Lunatimonas sp. TaxID=2060141 RepID=UPI00263AB69C|nr:hypothetical protein [Lunatimonas sp.]MCC5939736.1 hypothetical protein [Lunatimonas sp.]